MMGIFSGLLGPKVRAELSCTGLTEEALEHRIRNAIRGHRWICDKCGSTEFIEREVHCWICHGGSMIYRQVPPLVEVMNSYNELLTLKQRLVLQWSDLITFQSTVQLITDKAIKSLVRLLPKA